MLFWNRREVFVTNSMEQCSNVRNALAQSGIRYDYKVRNSNMTALGDSRGARVDRFGQGPEVYNTYYVYVHKKDLERAKEILPF